MDATGSRVGPFSFSADNVVIVIGSNKITPTQAEAVARAKNYQLPMESARARVAYAAMGVQGSAINNYRMFAALSCNLLTDHFCFSQLKSMAEILSARTASTSLLSRKLLDTKVLLSE